MAGEEIDPSEYHPDAPVRKGKTRELPMVDTALRQALSQYLKVRLRNSPNAKPTDPLFITQKGGPYSPNTLQDHMALILKDWAGLERASSHSGRRALLTDLIHNQEKPLVVAQKIAGHANPGTTIGYLEPPEEEIGNALRNVYQ